MWLDGQIRHEANKHIFFSTFHCKQTKAGPRVIKTCSDKNIGEMLASREEGWIEWCMHRRNWLQTKLLVTHRIMQRVSILPVKEYNYFTYNFTAVHSCKFTQYKMPTKARFKSCFYQNSIIW